MIIIREIERIVPLKIGFIGYNSQLTQDGLRQIKKNCPNSEIYSVLIKANLGTRIKRYIDRCGVDKFDFDDKNEIAARVERDFSMFLGLEKEVDIVMYNNEGTDIEDLVNAILQQIRGE